jgi:Asp-tRNA(Asn)/Glu-tRNA(Gln) amidotransferase C subunit
MKEEKTTIEQFNKVLKQVEKLHKIQLEIIEIEENLLLPKWNGDYTIRE